MGVDTRAGVVGTTCSSLRPEGRKADPLSRFAASGDWLSAVANPAPAPYTRADTSAKGGGMPGTGDPIQRALRRRAAELRGGPRGGERLAEGPSTGTTRRVFLARTAAAGVGAVMASPAGAAAG